MLAENRAQAILTEFDNGRAIAISFRIQTEYGRITFQLPARIDKVAKVLADSRLIPPRLRTPDQAARVAWRILRDWLEAQLAMTQASLVDLTQIMLPFAQDNQGRTVFERFKEQKFHGLLLTDNEPPLKQQG